MQATVPMLRGVSGASLKVLSEPLYHRLFVGGELARRGMYCGPRRRKFARRQRSSSSCSGHPTPGTTISFGRLGIALATADLGPNGIPLSCPRFDHWFGTVRRWARAGPSQGSPSARCPGRPATRAVLAGWSSSAPLRLIYRGRLVEQPTLADVTIAALRRVQSLTTTSS